MRCSSLYLTALILLSAVLTVLTNGLSHAASDQSDQQDSIRQCSALADDSQRLACFDRLAHDLALSPDNTRLHTDRNSTGDTQETKGDSFGLAAKPSTAQDDNERQTVIVAAHKKIRGAWVLTMENEQVWEQTDTARISAPSAGDGVTISKSSLGGFFVTINGRSIRAKRIQ